MNRIFRSALFILFSVFGSSGTAAAAVCDVNNDHVIDKLDIAAIFAARNTPASGAKDPRDADVDGTITVNDGRKCVLRCTLPACATPLVKVSSKVVSDIDNVYPTGRTVRIDVQPSTGLGEITGGNVRITSASQGYDSGIQPLKFGSIFFEWDTTGLAPAADYAVAVTLSNSGGQTATDSALVITLMPSPPAINKLVSVVDVSVSARGFPVNVVRSYLLDSTFDGPIGHGWTHSYRMRAVATPTFTKIGAQLIPADGNVQIFNADGTGALFKPSGAGTYQSPKGDFRTLTKASNGSYLLRGKHGNSFTFAAIGELTSVSDRNGNTQTLSYDSAGRLTTITDASGQKTNFTYDANSRIASITDPAGRAVTYGYDGNGNLISVTNNADVKTTYAYDANHNLTIVTDPLGKRTFFSVDAQDRLASVAGEAGANKVTFEYAVPAANQMRVSDALGNKTVLTYDNNASITQIVDPAGNTSLLTYDADLNLTALVDANGGQSTYAYDSEGNLLTATDAQGNTTTLSYNTSFNQVTSLVDAKGRTTTFEYDANGNLGAMTYPDGAHETYAYNGAGNLAGKADRKNQTIGFTYNAAGQLTRKSFPDGSEDTFAYDAVGNLVGAADENGTITLAYDSQDRLTGVTYPGGEVLAYAYDAASNRTQLSYPNGKTLTYSYDALNRLTQINESGQALAHYTYDALSRVTRRDLKNGTFATYIYDNAGRLLDLVNRKSSTEIISSFAYTYDLIGNRLSMTTPEGTTQYVYDAISQLIKVVRPDNAVTNYNLDPAGNRAAVSDTTGSTAYTSNDLNQYTAVGTDSYSYDANGNLITKTTPAGTTTYTYDYENRLVGVVTPSTTVTYAYDPFGRRVSKTNASGTTKYIHDSLRVILEKDTTNVQATYVHGIGIDEVLVMQRGGVEYFYSQDGLGSVTELTASGGNVVESYSYDVYGVPSTTSLVGNSYLFTGREYESETQLYYYRARYYGPHLGRFVSSDPIGFRGGLNTYSYVLSNPVNYVDPTGLVVVISWDRPAACNDKDGNVYLGCSLPYPNANGDWEIWLRPDRRNRLEEWTHEYIHARRRESGLDTHNVDFEEPLALALMWNPLFQEGTRQFLEQNGYFLGGDGQDTDGDGIPDDRDDDDDNDGVPDSQDSAPKDPLCGGANICAGDPTFIQLSNQNTQMTKGLFESPLKRRSAVSAHGLMAKIAVPYHNALVRADVPIFGLAHGENFKAYRVEFGVGETPSEWFALASSSSPQTKETTAADLDDSSDTTLRGNLANWDTGLKEYVYLPAYPKDHPIDLRGTYTLRLVVEGLDGNTVEDRVTVHVANVIPNAWGGRVTSQDGRFVLSVPEQALTDSFRLVLAQPVDADRFAPPDGKQWVGKVYEVREPGERFTKAARLEIAYGEKELGGVDPGHLSIYGYNAANKRWEPLDSLRRRDGNSLYTMLRRLHSHYALMASDLPAEWARLEPAPLDNPLQRASFGVADGHYLVKNDFENDLGQCSNRDHEVGASVGLDATTTFDGTKALKISNPNGGGNFAVNVVTQSFDVRNFPLVQFDYRIGAGVKTNFLVKVADRWYEIGFTDDPKELHDKRVNIAHIGAIDGIIRDGQWHTARFNLYDMLRTRTRHTLVDEMIMADWDVGGYMKLQFGSNAKGASYYIDNFTIGREVMAGLHMNDDRVLIDGFNQKKVTNVLGGVTATFTAPGTGGVTAGFAEQGANGHEDGHALRLDYDVAQPASYAGYVTALQNLDLRDYQALILRIKRGDKDSNLLVGLKDRLGRESKVRLMDYLPESASTDWQTVAIPLAAFSSVEDWAGLENLSFSFIQETHAKGFVLVDDLAVEKHVASLNVDHFERTDQRNAMGGQHLTFVGGAAAINGQIVHNSPNAVYRISYGGNIGTKGTVSGEKKSFAGWTTNLGGIDCSRCETLSFRIRGAEGGEYLSLYLDDGNFRWGVQLTQHAQVTTDWQVISIPIQAFAEYGVDLTHLAELQFVFEGQKMSGTIYLDDIRLGQGHD